LCGGGRARRAHGAREGEKDDLAERALENAHGKEGADGAGQEMAIAVIVRAERNAQQGEAGLGRQEDELEDKKTPLSVKKKDERGGGHEHELEEDRQDSEPEDAELAVFQPEQGDERGREQNRDGAQRRQAQQHAID